MKFSFFTVVLLLGILQGSIFIILLYRIKDKNKRANKFLSAFICLIVLTMLGRVLIDTKAIAQLPNFLALPDAVIYLYGPILYFYIKTLVSKFKLGRKELFIHLIPATLFVISEIPLLLDASNPLYIFWLKYIRMRFIIIEGSAIFLNICYLLLNVRLLLRYKKNTVDNLSFKQYPSYLTVILILIGICLISWLFSYLSWVIGFYNPFNVFGYGMIWLALVFITYALAYFAMNQPSLFKMPLAIKKEKEPLLKDNELNSLKAQLLQLMQEEKPYLKPRLTLHELATMLEINTSILSNVINVEFKQNFNDFINEYRIQEFIELSQKSTNEHLTILGLAYEAGFNSKTTFNTKFKKKMGKTPFQFIKEKKVTIE
ncbi:helix-turn-helix domain protein [Kordia sp. SMS9]|uniref:helix-turn-helix domain-containing protein n=1 Tax=Kordia sp. SMS9 TaxID=2282170 RepID=UPI000E0DC77C|nr:AraC family transcriptional regulator [Kordia sp. SMS9]AXG69739.1 helix-turn-helix domain protein [Kordia sp. SMS9]